MKVRLDVITMLGPSYLLLTREGAPRFPGGELQPGEGPGEAARRLVLDATGIAAPKLEVVDIRPAGQDLQIVMRALLPDTPTRPHTTAPRMGLPADLGPLAGPYVEDALKTSLAYKLTRGEKVK